MIVVLRFPVLDCSLHADSFTLSMQASCSVESWLLKDSLVTCSAVDPPHPSKLPCSIEQHHLPAMLHAPGRQQRRQQAQAGSDNVQTVFGGNQATHRGAGKGGQLHAARHPAAVRCCAAEAAQALRAAGGALWKSTGITLILCMQQRVGSVIDATGLKGCDLAMMGADPCC